MITRNFRKKRLAATMSLALGAVYAGPNWAQETDDPESEQPDVEVIEVSGIRGSLTKSMLIKRSSNGVVDAISAEDIGKFPDTNLAESLQRITGVSIDRTNGEGSRVTVRGFGPDYNIVTLNGRQMPAAAGGGRSFDFGNLASEGVAAVEVYKTSRAAQPTGGIGSTINLVTAKPLSNPGRKASVGAKGVYDSSTNENSALTPELSGIYSQTFNDDRFGVQIIGSYQKRNNGTAAASTGSGWYTIQGNQPDWGSLPQNGSFVNRPQENDVYAVPRSLAYTISEIERTRLNGQLTLQYRPVDNFTATLDYTYSELETQSTRSTISAWFNGVPTGGEYTQGTNTEGSVVGPVIYTDASCCDIAMGMSDTAAKNENNSLGLNLEWYINDNLSIEFDAHNSNAQSGPDGPWGNGNSITAVQFDRTSTTVDYSQDFPVMTITYPDGVNGLDPSRMLTSGTTMQNNYTKSDIAQYQFTGKYIPDSGLVSSIDFGIASIEVKNRTTFSNAQRDTWGGYGSPEDYPDDIFVKKSLPGKFSDVIGSNGAAMEPYYIQADFAALADAISAIAITNGDDLGPCDTYLCPSTNYDTDRRTTEKQLAVFGQAHLVFDIGQMPANLVFGARYEDTTVDSTALVPDYSTIRWSGANELVPVVVGETFTSLSGEYDHFLPAVDFNIEPIDDLILRASYSKTITRPGYADIQGGLTIATVARVNGGTGNSGNPGLLPFESDNIDISAEWYYEDGSYLSIGYFNKKVDNFIGNDTYTDTVFDLPNPAGGPRYDAAVAATGTTDNATIRDYFFAQGWVDANGDIVGIEGEDPYMEFSISEPVNSDERKVDGVEMAIQHLFGDSGFGTMINYTVVDGDVKYDNYNTNKGETPNQFVLLGLSDTANAVLFYDKDQWEFRIAWNWRDQFLSGTSDGNGENNPVYVESYSQIDVNISYDVTEDLVVFLEGINVTNEYQRRHGRHKNMLISIEDVEPRYNIGLRYNF